MKKKPEPGKIIRIAGNLMMLAAMGFLLKRLIGMGLRWDDFRAPGVSGAFLIGMVGQTLLFCVQCIPWLLFTQALSGKEIPFRRAMQVYTASNLCKYLPGNVFHLVGRNKLAADMHISHVDVACATVIDMLFCLLWMCVLSAILLGQRLSELAARYMGSFLLIGGIGIGILAGGAIVIRWKFRDKVSDYLSRYQKAFAPENRRRLYGGSLYYLLHNGSQGLMYFFCLKRMLPADTPIGTLLTLTGAFLFAWIVGFITPGAPGGIGIRESVMLLVSGADNMQEILLFVLVMRAASVAADVLAFLIGAATRRPQSTNRTGSNSLS